MSDNSRELAKLEWENGLTAKEIAEKLGLKLSTVSSWRTRHWNNDKEALKKRKKSIKNKKNKTRKEKVQKTSLAGPPQGNKNAAGNTGGLKHGGFSAVYWDTLSEEEKEMIDEMYSDEEKLLIDQIKLLSVRERRLMRAVALVTNTDTKNKELQSKQSQIMSSITISNEKKRFKNKEDKEHYEMLRQEKINEDKISYLYENDNVTTSKVSSLSALLGLESELTKVQKQKTRCIESLATLRRMKQESGQTNSDYATLWAQAVIDADNGIVEVKNNE